MNLHLEKCEPPIQVHDLFQDIQDGHILMALLEELSGCRLLHGFKKSSHRIFRLNNIAKVLTFLEERNVKLVSIDAADVADGNSSIILGLIWNIILFFQIKELTGNIRSQFPSSSSLSSIPNSSDSDMSHSSTPSEERPSAATAMRENSKAIKKLLQWIQKRTRKYGVAVQDFGKSWTSGLAFLAVIKSIDSSLVDMRKALLRSPRENLEEAFRIAHYSLGIPRLLEPEDVAINTPDEQSIIMYVSQFLEHFPGIEEPEESRQLIERSVSMGRLNFRDRDSDHGRNGAHSLRGRCSMFQKEPPPPKILISSVSEDRSVLSPRLRVVAARSWSSEDFLTDSPHMDDASSSVHVAATEQDSPHMDDASSSVHVTATEQDSAHMDEVSSSVHVAATEQDSPQQSHESVISDSAINSPDSWMESELMPERFCESHSDGSLCDSESAWDVYRATPVEVTPLDEGFNSSLEDRAPDEQSMTGSCTEEEMCSLKSARDGIHGQSERNQDLDNQNQDLGTEPEPDLRERNNPTEMDSEQKDVSPPQKDKKLTEPEPSSTLCETEVLICSGAEDLESDQPNQVQSGPSTALQAPDEEDGAAESPYREEEWAEGEQGGQRKNSDSQETGSGPDEAEESLKERDDRGIETPNKDHSRDEESSSSSSAVSQPGLTIPLISISEEPDEEAVAEQVSRTQGPEGLNHVSTVEQLSEDLTRTPPEPVSGPDKHDDKQAGGSADDSQVGSDLTAQGLSAQPLNPEEEMNQGSDGHQDRPTDACSDTEAVGIQQNSLDPDTLKLNGQIAECSEPESGSRTLNPFYSDQSSSTEDLVGDPVEPMDLFYPDKEEPVFTEPSDTDIQRWPSVLSVSALQPAPASEDQEPDLQDEEFRGDMMEDQAHIKAIRQTSEESEDSPASQEQCVLCGVTIVGLQDDAGGSLESERRSSGSSSRADEIQIPPVLRHRKGARLTEHTDHQRATPRKACHDDFWFGENWELYLLLLLWLLLYSFWLLPQIDPKTLPSLLLNLDR
ncbi:uncharacterized protein clmna isoform X2 [Leuresthes tenuis]